VIFIAEIAVFIPALKLFVFVLTVDIYDGSSTGGKYGFAEQIIDGMCVSINSVVINFHAKDFTASIQLSRILIQSRTPVWQAGSLKMTRLKDDLRGEVMIFKEAEWQTLRIEANALDTGDPLLSTTPLRLIANQSKIRVTIKKRMSGKDIYCKT